MFDFARSWHATADEIAADYPAHRYVRSPYLTLLRATDVAAPPATVFRWLCQLKVAPYSYDWIDNRGRPSPRELTSGAEQLATGQWMMIGPIVEFEPDRHITLTSRTAAFGEIAMTYQVSAAGGHTRLVGCIDIATPSWAQRRRADLLAVGDLVMMRRQLLNLKELAERS